MLGIPIIKPKSSSGISKRSSTNQTLTMHMCYLGSKGFPMFTTVRTSLPIGIFKVKRCDKEKLRTCQVFHLPVLNHRDVWSLSMGQWLHKVLHPRTPRTMEETNTSTEHHSSTQLTAQQGCMMILDLTTQAWLVNRNKWSGNFDKSFCIHETKPGHPRGHHSFFRLMLNYCN